MADSVDGTQQTPVSGSGPPAQVTFPPPLGRPPPPPLGRPPPPPPALISSHFPPRPPPPPPELNDDRPLCDPTTGERINKEQRNSPPRDSAMKETSSSSSEKSTTGASVSTGKADSSGGLLGKRSGGPPIKIKLKSQEDGSKKAKVEPVAVKKTTSLVSQAFGSDSEDDEEEMPPEAKLRMRNIGKNTPTSSGPNSFNKSRKGFSDPRGSWRNELTDD